MDYWEITIRAEPPNTREAFVRGMIAAIEGFGIMRDGVLVIGCQEERVKDVKAEWQRTLIRYRPDTAKEEDDKIS